ncbi:MAG: hypothetical protein JWO02_220, partial [Solirubrobacterales bacterium]|nr:hypothetical protein [Solirubrobacterales bacterium]
AALAGSSADTSRPLRTCESVTPRPGEVATPHDDADDPAPTPLPIPEVRIPGAVACGSGGALDGTSVSVAALAPSGFRITGLRLSTGAVLPSTSGATGATFGVTVSRLLTVQPVGEPVARVCHTIPFRSYWTGTRSPGAPSLSGAVSSLRVTGRLGCDLYGSRGQTTLSPGDSVTVLDGTTIGVLAGPGSVAALADLPTTIDVLGADPGIGGLPVDLAAGSVRVAGPIRELFTTVHPIGCAPTPATVTAEGGTTTLAGTRLLDAAGNELPADDTFRLLRGGGCLREWGVGADALLPGTEVTFSGVPRTDDPGLAALPSERRDWFVSEWRVQGNQFGFVTPAQGGAALAPALSPVLIGDQPSPEPGQFAVRMPFLGPSGPTAEPPAAVGARYGRVDCTRLTLIADSPLDFNPGAHVLGVVGAPAKAGRVRGSIDPDSDGNCPVLGKGWYRPGTKVQLKTVDGNVNEVVTRFTGSRAPVAGAPEGRKIGSLIPASKVEKANGFPPDGDHLALREFGGYYQVIRAPAFDERPVDGGKFVSRRRVTLDGDVWTAWGNFEDVQVPMRTTGLYGGGVRPTLDLSDLDPDRNSLGGQLIKDGTVTVGQEPVTVRAAWRPSTCEKLSWHAPNANIVASLTGSAPCGGPDTTWRDSDYAIEVVPPGAATPIVAGTSRVSALTAYGVGGSTTLTAGPRPGTSIKFCYPVELGGVLSDTGTYPVRVPGSVIGQLKSRPNGGSLTITPEQTASFATGPSCGVPGFFLPGTVTFATPKALKADGTVMRWMVDGEPVAGDTAAVRVNQNSVEHAVGLEASVRCVRLELQDRDWPGEPPVYQTAPNCPLDHADQHIGNRVGKGADGEAIGYFLPGTEVKVSFNGIPDCLTGSDLPGDALRATITIDHARTIVFHRLSEIDCDVVTLVESGINRLLDLPVLGTALTKVLFDPTTILAMAGKDLFTTNPFTSSEGAATSLRSLAVVSAAIASVYYGGGGGALSFLANAGLYDQVGRAGAQLLTEPKIFASPTAFGNFFAGAATGIGIGGLVNAALPGWGQLLLTGVDLGLSAGAEINDAAGGPSALTRGLRTARAASRAFDAVQSCAAGAAAGNTPPVSNSEWQRIGIGTAVTVKGAVKEYREANKIGPKLPTPLTFALNTAGPGIAGKGAALATAYARSLRDNPLSSAGAIASSLASFDNAGRSWTPGEYMGCLMANTIGSA